MKDKLLVSCGCSFTYGNSGNFRHVPFGDLLSSELGTKHINLSRPGASNYYIAKQIEHSLTLSPDFVCIGVTTNLRFDYLENIDSITKDITYNDFKISLNDNSSDKIESRSILWFDRSYQNKEHSLDKRKSYFDIFKFLTKNTNYHIKKDQDKLIILGSCLQLIKKNIPYIILDFSETLQNDDNIIGLNWKNLQKQFPCNHDQYHFNQEGHIFIKNKIIEFLKIKYPNLLGVS